MVLTRVFAYVLLFVIKCRFPAGKSVADIIRDRYNNKILNKTRRLEKLDFKIRKRELDVEFIQTCIQNNLIPKFLNFKVPNSALRDSKAYRECQSKLLKEELSSKQSSLRAKRKEMKKLKDELVRSISLVDYTHIISLFTKSNDVILSKCQQRQKKKLYSLGFFERDKDVNDPDQVIHNFSSYVLSDVEKSLLAKGLNFCLPTKMLNFADYMTPFELLYRDVKGCDLDSFKLDMFRVNLKKIAFSSFNRYNFLKELNLSQPEYDALKNLSSNKDIVIHKSDKGNSVVIVNRDDYLKRLQEMVDDESKFEKLNVSPGKDYNFMVKEKSTVDKLLSNLLAKKSIDDNVKKKLSPNGPQPARLYGSPKIHKPPVDGVPKYRPIISQIGAATYNIAKFLHEYIKPHTVNEHTVTDTFDFVSMLDGKDHRLFMASLDVESLFTNIPLNETIDIVTQRVYGDKQKVDGLSKDDFKRLLEISTKGSVFYFNGCYYRQKDGVAMGSPLGPDLANAFLAHHESIWLEECPLAFAPVFYARYVDDIFVLLRSSDHVVRLCEYFSSRHVNIRFTYEVENNNRLPFLDVDVFRESDRFSSTVHRKDTFSGVFTNFQSFLPDVYKRGLVATLLHRAYMINSSYTSLHNEIENLKKIFGKNRYPLNFIDKCIFRFLNKMYTKKETVHTVPKKDFLIVLPFLGSISGKVRNELMKSFKELSQAFNIKIIFKSSRKMSSFFSYKDSLPKSLLSGIIYQFQCAGCNLRYIGSTKRYFEKRLEEHLHKSALTGKSLSGMQMFTPMHHVRTKCRHESPCMGREDFKVIGREQNPFLLLIKESLFIYKLRPELNNNDACVPLKLFRA